MNQIIHNVFVVAESIARQTLIKSCFAISQKRPTVFAWEDGVLQDGTGILLCDMSSSESLLSASRRIRQRQQDSGSLSVIFIYDSETGIADSKELVRRSGLEGWWKPELVLDSKSHWARLLGILELAAKKRVIQSNEAVPDAEAPDAAPRTPQKNEARQVTMIPVRPMIPMIPVIPVIPLIPVIPVSPVIPVAPVAPVMQPRPMSWAQSGADLSSIPTRPLAPPSAPVDTRRPILILLVDDSESARAFVIKKLQSSWDQRFIFDVAETGKQAKEKCQEKKYDILFLDVVLPDLDGYSVCKNLKNTKNIHSMAVMLTSKGGAFDKLRGVMSGCDMYLVKPLDEDEIMLLAKKYTAEYM